MMLSQTSILGVKITANAKSEIFDEVAGYLTKLQQVQPLVIHTPNPEQIVYAQSYPDYKELLNSADVALPDGIGIVWAIGKYQIRRIPGIDFMEDLIRLAAEKSYPVACIGGWGDTAEKALANLQKKYPGLAGWAETPHEFQISNFKFPIPNTKNENQNEKHVTPDVSHLTSHVSHTTNHIPLVTRPEDTDDYFIQLAKRIGESGTRIVFVGLGAPKQEYFIDNIKYQISNIKSEQSLLFMSVGGSLDIFAGNVKRAPQVIQRLHLEWLWRLIQEPWRIRRQSNLLTFMYLTLKRRYVLQSD